MLVRPQAMRALCPMKTVGILGSFAPATECLGASSRARYQRWRARPGPTAAMKRARRISLEAFAEARSQAIILLHTSQSTGSNGAALVRSRRNSIGRALAVARYWLMPAA